MKTKIIAAFLAASLSIAAFAGCNTSSDRTLVGLIVIGIVIVAISFAFNKIQKYLLRWKH